MTKLGFREFYYFIAVADYRGSKHLKLTPFADFRPDFVPVVDVKPRTGRRQLRRRERRLSGQRFHVRTSISWQLHTSSMLFTLNGDERR